MKDNGDYVRTAYGVPAHRGTRVTWCDKPGVITGFVGQYIRVKLDDPLPAPMTEAGCTKIIAHPTWRMCYLTDTAVRAN